MSQNRGNRLYISFIPSESQQALDSGYECRFDCYRRGAGSPQMMSSQGD